MSKLNTGVRSIILFSSSISLFLILGYDRLHQWDEAFYLYQAAFVPVSKYNAFLTGKYGHLSLLKALIGLTGTGLDALFYLDLVYALMVLAFVFVSFRILKEMLDDKNDALYTATILMFLPLTLYLSFKTLSEVPALLLSSTSILYFFFGLKEGHRYRSLFFTFCSGIILFFATVCRSDAPIMFFSFLLALTAIYWKTYRLKKLFSSVAVVCMVFSALLFILIMFLNIDIFSYYFSDVHRSAMYHQSIYLRLFETFLVGSLFYPLIIFSFPSYREKRFKFAFIWFISATIPIWIVSNHIEARFLYPTLIPFSMLVFIGSSRLFSRVGRVISNNNTIKTGIVALIFAGIVIANLFCMGFMENELDENDYIHLFKKIDNLYDNKIILIPYAFTDYSFLKFAFPDEQIFTVQNIKNTEEERKRMEEEYGDGYIGGMESLRKLDNTTILYISWHSQKDYCLFKGNEYGVYNYSWITEEPGIKLKKILEEGDIKKRQYEVYVVNIE